MYGFSGPEFPLPCRGRFRLSETGLLLAQQGPNMFDGLTIVQAAVASPQARALNCCVSYRAITSLCF
jgi:hypothetical protein